MRRFIVLVIALACGSACSSTGPSGTQVHSCSGASAVAGTMSATVDGTSFVATCLDSASFANGVVSLGGTNVTSSTAASFIDISMAVNSTVAGTYTLSSGSVSNASLTVGGAQRWEAGGAFGGSGTITISSIGAAEVIGTFSFVLSPGPGGTGTKNVTNGQFDILF